MGLQRNLAQAFDSIPESKFSYKPTPVQLTIGYVAQHLANVLEVAAHLELGNAEQLLLGPLQRRPHVWLIFVADGGDPAGGGDEPTHHRGPWSAGRSGRT